MQKLKQNLQYLCEEFVQLVPLKGTTTGADMLKAVLSCLEENKLDLEKTCLCYNRYRSRNGRSKERFCFLA